MNEAGLKGELPEGGNYRAAFYNGMDAGFNHLFVAGRLHAGLDVQARQSLTKRFSAALDAGLNSALHTFSPVPGGHDTLHPLLIPPQAVPNGFFESAGILTPKELRAQNIHEANAQDAGLVRVIGEMMISTLEKLQGSTGITSRDIAKNFAMYSDRYRSVLDISSGGFENHIENEMGIFLTERKKMM